MSVLVSLLSDTQRVVVDLVEVKGTTRLEVRKEWRKTADQPWESSKGITIPLEDLDNLTRAVHTLQGGIESGEY